MNFPTYVCSTPDCTSFRSDQNIFKVQPHRMIEMWHFPEQKKLFTEIVPTALEKWRVFNRINHVACNLCTIDQLRLLADPNRSENGRDRGRFVVKYLEFENSEVYFAVIYEILIAYLKFFEYILTQLLMQYYSRTTNRLHRYIEQKF